MLYNNTIDKIYILHNIPKTERMENMKYQINCLGLYNSLDIVWKYTTPNMFKEIYYKEHIKSKKYFSYAMFDCALGHYEIMKEALSLGYKRIMILEDDIVFHKNFATYIENIPFNADLVLCEYNSIHVKKSFFSIDNGDLFLPYDTECFFHTGGYFVKRKYMEYYVKKQENHINLADEYLHKHLHDTDDDLQRYVTNKPIILQIPDGNSIGDDFNYSHLPIKSYIGQNVQFEDYSLTEKQKQQLGNLKLKGEV